MFDEEFYDSVDFDALLNDLAENELDPLSVIHSDTTDASILSDSCDSDAPVKKTSKKNKKVKSSEDESSVSEVVILPKPKILRSDIRRSYSTMFVNVMNNGDFPLLFGFFDTFSHPSLYLQMTKHHETIPTPDNRKTFKVNGINSAVRFWYYNFFSLPDRAVTGVSCKIITPIEGTGSRIVCTYRLNGTALLEDIPDSFVNAPFDSSKLLTESASVGKKRNKTDEENNRTFIMKDIMETVENMVCTIPLRSQPINICVDGQLTFYLDDDKRIIKMVLDGTQADRKR